MLPTQPLLVALRPGLIETSFILLAGMKNMITLLAIRLEVMAASTAGAAPDTNTAGAVGSVFGMYVHGV